MPLTSEEHKSYIKRQKSATFVIKSLRINLPTIKNTVKLEIIVIIPAVHIVYVIWNLVYLNTFMSFFAMNYSMIIILS